MGTDLWKTGEIKRLSIKHGNEVFGERLEQKDSEIERLERELRNLNQKHSELQLLQSETVEQRDQLTREKEDALGTVAQQKERLAGAKTFLLTVDKNVGSLSIFIRRLTHVLGCLCCMEFVLQPMMLQCGHSICQKCVKQHLHPWKTDSVVLC